MSHPRLTLAVIITATVTLTGCASMLALPTSYSQTARYETSLVEVARPKATKERWGAVDKIALDSSKYIYEDALVRVALVAGRDAIQFAVANKTEHSVKLVWDEATFIGADGKVSKVMHEGVKFADRNASQPPSVIPARQTLSDGAWPNDRVYFSEGYYGRYTTIPAEWKHLALILPSERTQQVASGVTVTPDPTLESQAMSNKGKRFGLILPLQIEGVTNEYTFWFEIKTVSVSAPTTAR